MSLKIRVKVQIILSLPRFVKFGRVMKGAQPVKYVSFIGRDKDNTKVVSVKSKQEFIKVDFNPSGFENDKRKQIKITLKPGFKKGLFKENLTVYTDHKQIKQRQVTVVAKVVDNIEAKPKTLTFGAVKKGSRAERSIRVKALFDKAFKIVDVRTSEPELETKVETVKDGKEYLVKVFLNEKFDRKLLEGKIIIETDDEDQRQIEIGVYGAMLDRSKN